MLKFHILTIDDKDFILSLTIIVKPYEYVKETFSKNFKENIFSLSFSPSGEEIMVNEGYRGLRIYNRKTEEEIFSKDFEKSIYHPTFSPSGKEIIVREGFGGLRIYKIIGKKRK